MNAEILAVGTELLLGDILNTDAQYLAREMAALGIGVMHQGVVGDNPERLAHDAEQALARSEILITSGGLGPTCDDITREIISKVLGLPLVFHEESFRRMKNFFDRTGRVMTENNRKQAMLPEGSVVFDNDWGTAPACAVEKDGKIVIMLPGPPRELTPIFETRVKPYLAKFSDSVIFSQSLRVYGMGESAVEDRLSDLMQGGNPTLAPYAKDGEVLLRVTARSKTEDEAKKLCAPVTDEIIKRLGNYVYGRNVDSLQQVVVKLLTEKKLKIATAESCTGGLLAERITQIPGSSDVFEYSAVCYANRIKEKMLGVKHETLETYGAVSEQTAAEMASGVRAAASSDIGVGITGIAGPTGGSDKKPVGLVYVAVCDRNNCFVNRLMLGRGTNERELIRYLAASNALDMARRLICGIPQEKGCKSILS